MKPFRTTENLVTNGKLISNFTPKECTDLTKKWVTKSTELGTRTERKPWNSLTPPSTTLKRCTETNTLLLELTQWKLEKMPTSTLILLSMLKKLSERPSDGNKRWIKLQIELLTKPTTNTLKRSFKSTKDTPRPLNTRSKTLISTLVNQEVTVNSTGPTNKKLLTNGPNQSLLRIEPRLNGGLKSLKPRKRNGESTIWLKLRHKKSGQRNSRLSKTLGKNSLKTLINNTLLFPKLKSKLPSLTFITKKLNLVKPSLAISLPTTTTLLTKEKNGKETSRHTLPKEKSSTNNSLMLINLRLKTSMSPRRTEELMLMFLTKRKLSINGPLLKPTASIATWNLRKISLTTKTLFLLIKLLSKLPLKLNGQRNSRLSKIPLRNSMPPLEVHKLDKTCKNHKL